MKAKALPSLSVALLAFLTSFALAHLPEAAKWAPALSPNVQVQRNPNTE